MIKDGRKFYVEGKIEFGGRGELFEVVVRCGLMKSYS